MATRNHFSVGLVIAVGVAATLAGLGCEPTRRVTRVDPATVQDLDYRFDEDDARQTAQTMIADSLARPWIDNWLRERSANPVMIVGQVVNDTSDYIDAQLFTRSIERALLNSGRVTIVASAGDRGQLREERAQQRDWSRPETVKQMAYEYGAGVMLLGRIGESVEVSPSGNRRIQYYQVNLEIVDIESNVKLWIGEEQIEKRVRSTG